MAGLIVAAGVMCAATIITASRFFDLRKMLGYAGIIDVAFTILMFYMFMGTFSGIVAGAFGGLFMTLALTGLKHVVGYKKLQRHGVKLVWVEYPATWKGFVA